MDALTSNIRTFAQPSSLPDKRSLPESPSTTGVSANAPSDIAAKPVSNDGNNAQQTSADIEVAVKTANHFLEQISRELRFERSETGGKIVVQVTDQKTGAVIRQFPSEVMLKLSEDLEKMTGLLFRDSA